MGTSASLPSRNAGDNRHKTPEEMLHEVKASGKRSRDSLMCLGRAWFLVQPTSLDLLCSGSPVSSDNPGKHTVAFRVVLL